MNQQNNHKEQFYQFFNDFGILFEHYFYLDRNNDSRIFYLNNVSKIKLIRGRDLKLNCVFFLSALICVYIGFFIDELLILARLLSIIVSIFFFSLSIIYETLAYKIIIVTKDLNFINIKVNSTDKDEAKEIVYKINKKLKNKEKVANYNMREEVKYN